MYDTWLTWNRYEANKTLFLKQMGSHVSFGAFYRTISFVMCVCACGFAISQMFEKKKKVMLEQNMHNILDSIDLFTLYSADMSTWIITFDADQ